MCVNVIETDINTRAEHVTCLCKNIKCISTAEPDMKHTCACE